MGKDSTAAQRRHLYARYLAAKTEFWRSHRACAGVLEFCGLGYARPDGQTSDHFLDVEKLTFEPEFQTYVRDAFAPVGLMLDFWDETLPGGKAHDFPVVVINDFDHDWKGQVRLRLQRASEVVEERRCLATCRPWAKCGWCSIVLCPAKPAIMRSRPR